MKGDIQTCSLSAKHHNRNAYVVKEAISNELKAEQEQSKFRNVDNQFAKPMKKVLENDSDGDGKATNNAVVGFDRKYCKYGFISQAPFSNKKDPAP